MLHAKVNLLSPDCAIVRDPVDEMKGCPNRVALSIGGRGCVGRFHLILGMYSSKGNLKRPFNGKSMFSSADRRLRRADPICLRSMRLYSFICMANLRDGDMIAQSRPNLRPRMFFLDGTTTGRIGVC